MSELKPCPMRAENGNCSPVGGFCTSVPELYCEAANRAYQTGYHDGATEAMRRAQPANEPLTHCRDCTKAEPFQGNYICSEYGGIWGENDGCTHGERQPERSENDG